MAGKSIIAAVGLGGRNLPNDVITVQFLLNCVPLSDGGPVEELEVDGLVGPLTNGAIQRFQRSQFGWADGRVDPEHVGGVTIVKLNEFDPTPSLPIPHLPTLPHLPGGGGRGKGGKKTGGKGRPRIFLPGKKGGKGGGKKATG